MRTRTRKKAGTILIVDDEPLIRLVLVRSLVSFGYRVIEAAAGEEGLKQAAEEKCDAVILDYRLPDMTGLDFTRRIHENNGKIPVILTSAFYIGEDELDRARRLGISGFIRKPFKGEALRVRVASVVKGRRGGLWGRRFFTSADSSDLRSGPLARKIYKRLFREGLDLGGHVHFHFRDFDDHVILLCQRRNVGKVIAKNPTCGKGRYLRWENSQFSGYKPDKVLVKLAGRVNEVKVDTSDYDLRWSTLYDFLCWLEISYG